MSMVPQNSLVTNFLQNIFQDIHTGKLLFIYLIHEFHILSWITEINGLFHNILIYWDAPVYIINYDSSAICLLYSM